MESNIGQFSSLCQVRQRSELYTSYKTALTFILHVSLYFLARRAFENLLLPGLEGPALLGELIAEERDLQLEFVVVGGVVVNMAVISPFVAIGQLQGTALSLVGSRFWVCRIAWKIELFYRCVAGASVSGE
jgi:hypothetical protein